MTPVYTSHRSKLWLYAVLSLVFVACLWVGWRDFDPLISQGEIRESIRSNIRWAVQALVQYAIPGAIIIYFGKEAIAKFRAR